MAKINALDCVAQDDICSLRIICTLARKGQYNLEQLDTYGNTALLKACFLGKMECAQILLDFGANIRATNYFGQNALTLATHAGHYALVVLLLRHRPYDDFNNSSIVPALCVAILRRHTRLVVFFKRIDSRRGRDIQTVHGLSVDDIEHMMCQSEAPHKAMTRLQI